MNHIKTKIVSSVGCFNVSKIPSRIIGGNEVKIEDFYWQVSMSFKGNHACGGSIISEDRILTAAHCIYRINRPDKYKHILIRAGSRHHNKGGVQVKITKIIQHPDFNVPSYLNNDIAVIILQEKLKFSSTIGSIPIPVQDEVLRPNSMVSITGWGLTKDTYSTKVAGTENLLGIEVPVVDFDRCAKAYKKYPGRARLTDFMFCAGLLGVGGRDACQGDSGGILLCFAL